MEINIRITTLQNLSRAQKILLALYKLSDGKQIQVRFEDIAVEAFRNFPENFQLKGYPEYPDTGDIIHKPLYSELKSKGYVLSGNKYFTLTPKGLQYSKSLLNIKDKNNAEKDYSGFVKFTSDQQKEIEAIKESDSFRLFSQGKGEDILDIDFFNYLGVTVRTNKFDFLGRLKTIEDVIKACKSHNKELSKVLENHHKYVLGKFKSNVEYVRNSKGGKRW